MNKVTQNGKSGNEITDGDKDYTDNSGMTDGETETSVMILMTSSLERERETDLLR